MISVDLWMTEEEFTYLEKQVKNIRGWLDAGPNTRLGRGNEFVAAVRKLRLYLHVARSKGQVEEEA
jgi:hypothetical protein